MTPSALFGLILGLVTAGLFAIDLVHDHSGDMPHRRRRSDTPERLFEGLPADDVFRRRLRAVTG